MRLFKKKDKSSPKIDGLEKIPKKRRKRALELLEEYNNGLIVNVDEDKDQKEKIESIRKGK